MSLENRLRTAGERSAPYAPDIPAIVERGHHLRRRRRMTTTMATLALFAVVGIAAANVLPQSSQGLVASEGSTADGDGIARSVADNQRSLDDAEASDSDESSGSSDYADSSDSDEPSESLSDDADDVRSSDEEPSDDDGEMESSNEYPSDNAGDANDAGSSDDEGDTNDAGPSDDDESSNDVNDAGPPDDGGNTNNAGNEGPPNDEGDTDNGGGDSTATPSDDDEPSDEGDGSGQETSDDGENTDGEVPVDEEEEPVDEEEPIDEEEPVDEEEEPVDEEEPPDDEDPDNQVPAGVDVGFFMCAIESGLGPYSCLMSENQYREHLVVHPNYELVSFSYGYSFEEAQSNVSFSMRKLGGDPDCAEDTFTGANIGSLGASGAICTQYQPDDGPIQPSFVRYEVTIQTDDIPLFTTVVTLDLCTQEGPGAPVLCASGSPRN